MKILVTGGAGFIGYHLSEAFLKEGHSVVGLDNINDYYDINLKYDRLEQLGITRKDAETFNQLCSSSTHGDKMRFIRMGLENRISLPALFKAENFDLVVNLAAQAGVRYSIENPETYVDSNIVGFLNILECCRHHGNIRLLYASSSSVYGKNKELPFSEDQRVDEPISLYAATKKANELMAHTYSHLYGMETIGLRFFTVYGPWGRPDMALFLFTAAVLNDKPIKVFNYGNMSRDFTYIDDIIQGIIRIVKKPINIRNSRIYNIGNGSPVALKNVIEEIEKQSCRKAKKELFPMQPGDVAKTWSDTTRLAKDTGYISTTSILAGVRKFLNWYRLYYNDNLNHSSD